jgi:regulator of protease activity HflC (stomatin/prohibitin superfamily)
VILIISIKIVKETSARWSVRLGRLLNVAKGPGIIIIIHPFIDRWVRVSLRLVAMDVAPQDVITRTTSR